MCLFPFLFSLAKLQANIQLKGEKKLLTFHGVMYYSAQNNNATLAIRGQTSADKQMLSFEKMILIPGNRFCSPVLTARKV